MKKCHHKSNFKISREQYIRVRQIICAVIHFCLAQNNLIFKSQSFVLKKTVPNLLMPGVELKLRLVRNNTYYILNTPFKPINCKIPLCRLAFFCLHTKPSIDSLLFDKIEKQISLRLTKYFEQMTPKWTPKCLLKNCSEHHGKFF